MNFFFFDRIYDNIIKHGAYLPTKFSFHSFILKIYIASTQNVWEIPLLGISLIELFTKLKLDLIAVTCNSMICQVSTRLITYV